MDAKNEIPIIPVTPSNQNLGEHKNDAMGIATAEPKKIANEEPRAGVVIVQEEKEVVETEKKDSTQQLEELITLEDGRFKFNSFNSVLKFAKAIAFSNLVPTDYQRKPTDIALCISMGLEKGLSPFQSLLSITVIKGRPCLWGNAQLALAQNTGELEEYKVVYEGERKTDAWQCTVSCKRKGGIVYSNTYGWIDAKDGGLLTKDNWKNNPKIMLENRASGAVLKRAFANVFCGIHTAEEMQDVTPDNSNQPKTQGLDDINNKMKIED